MVKVHAKLPTPVSRPMQRSDEQLCWCSVNLGEVVGQESRLKAADFSVEARQAKKTVEECKWPKVTVAGKAGMAMAFRLPRFKQVQVRYSEYPIYQPGQINELNPKPANYLSPLTQTNIDDLRVKKGQVLMTCSGRSGSIGRTAYVSDTLHGRIFSSDLIRLECLAPDTAGYLYAFLNTKTGRALIRSNEYGAMIPHINPTHLESIPVPDPPMLIKKRIHDLVVDSYALRDKSNTLLADAERLLYDALNLPPLGELRPHLFEKNAGFNNLTVKLSGLRGRLDAAFHAPIIDSIIANLRSAWVEITTVGDPRISKTVYLPGRFSRVYVEKGMGAPFFGGKQIYQLDPTGRKFLSLKIHGPRIQEQLTLGKHMILVTRSGTVGKVAFVPGHWKGFIASDHIIRVIPASIDIAGYLYVFLATDYGCALINRFSYGSVVGQVNAHHISQVPVPLLKDQSILAEINRLALDANTKLADAYSAERKAISITNNEAVHMTHNK